jgi:hypothetical protein
MDPFQQLLETALIGTPIQVPLEARVHEISFDPNAVSAMGDAGVFTIKWKTACAADPGAFDEPEAGQPKKYLIAEIRLARSALADNPLDISALRLDIAEWSGRDIAEFMVIGANYCRENGK